MKHFKIIFLIFIFLFSCKKNKDQTNYKLSDELCVVCEQPIFYIIGTDTIQVQNIVTPNMDNINDHLVIHKYHHYSLVDSTNITIYNREGGEIAHFEYYKNNWPQYYPYQSQQNLEGLSNGLYKYKLFVGSKQISGIFILIFTKNEYIDKHVYEIDCIKNCKCFEVNDPAFYSL